MALIGKRTDVEAARKVLGDAETAAAKEGERLEKAIEAADRYAGEAASVDPDADPREFERATAKLAELRATVEIVRTREAAAKARAEAAREALAAAENAANRAQLEAVNREVREREAAALADLRAAFTTFASAVTTVSEAANKAQALEARLRAAGVTDVRALRTTTAGWAGIAPWRLAQLAGESQGWR